MGKPKDYLQREGLRLGLYHLKLSDWDIAAIEAEVFYDGDVFNASKITAWRKRKGLPAQIRLLVKCPCGSDFRTFVAGQKVCFECADALNGSADKAVEHFKKRFSQEVAA